MTTKDNPAIEKAYRHLRRLSADDRARLLAEAQEKAERDAISEKEYAEKKGRAEGREEERVAAARRTALAGLKKNYPMEMIIDFSGLTRQEIEDLRKTL